MFLSESGIVPDNWQPGNAVSRRTGGSWWCVVDGVLLAPRRGVKRGGGKGGSSRTGDNSGGRLNDRIIRRAMDI